MQNRKKLSEPHFMFELININFSLTKMFEKDYCFL